MTEGFKRLWFWISQIMAFLSMATIVDQAKSWAEFIKWAVESSPAIVGVFIEYVAAALDFVSTPWRLFSEIFLELLGLNLPDWTVSVGTLIILIVLGAFRGAVFQRNMWHISDEYGVEEDGEIVIRNGRETGLFDAAINRMDINKHALFVFSFFSLLVLVSDFLFWVVS